MRSFGFVAALVIVLCGRVNSQAAGRAEERTFELTPAVPPAPALKYKLLFGDLTERRPGNAAILYLDAILLLGPDSAEMADRALAAFDAGDRKTFDSVADSLEQPNLFQELELAGRRETCDWQPPLREMGVRTALPHLSPLRNGVAKVVKVRALRQIELGKIDDAVATLRLGYELSNKVGREPVIISGLVAANITGMINDATAHLMNRPEAPNLYWALRQVPCRKSILRDAMEGETLGSSTSAATLASTSATEELSASQWRAVFESIGQLIPIEGGPAGRIDPIGQTTPDMALKARTRYAQTHHMNLQYAAKVDPAIILGSFYYEQYGTLHDAAYKLRDLPYPQLLAKSREFDLEVAKVKKEQPANPFLQGLPVMDKAAWAFARVDRQLAALMTVEALRAYAAAHGGALPERLDQITDTPAPHNPATGKSFEYRAENQTAILSDSASPDALTYRITIRK